MANIGVSASDNQDRREENENSQKAEATHEPTQEKKGPVMAHEKPA